VDQVVALAPRCTLTPIGLPPATATRPERTPAGVRIVLAALISLVLTALGILLAVTIISAILLALGTVLALIFPVTAFEASLVLVVVAALVILLLLAARPSEEHEGLEGAEGPVGIIFPSMPLGRPRGGKKRRR
jgi:hypothetical protein